MFSNGKMGAFPFPSPQQARKRNLKKKWKDGVDERKTKQR